MFSKGDEYLTTLEDGTMISGWDTGLANLRKGDRAVIRCVRMPVVATVAAGADDGAADGPDAGDVAAVVRPLRN